MSSVCKGDQTGRQLELDRENWFSSEAIQLLEDAVENPAVGPEKMLAMLLHHGLGLPLSLVAKLTGTTKNVVAKQVISGKRSVRRHHQDALQSADGQPTLF